MTISHILNFNFNYFFERPSALNGFCVACSFSWPAISFSFFFLSFLFSLAKTSIISLPA